MAECIYPKSLTDIATIAGRYYTKLAQAGLPQYTCETLVRKWHQEIVVGSQAPRPVVSRVPVTEATEGEASTANEAAPQRCYKLTWAPRAENAIGEQITLAL